MPYQTHKQQSRLWAMWLLKWKKELTAIRLLILKVIQILTNINVKWTVENLYRHTNWDSTSYWNLTRLFSLNTEGSRNKSANVLTTLPDLFRHLSVYPTYTQNIAAIEPDPTLYFTSWRIAELIRKRGNSLAEFIPASASYIRKSSYKSLHWGFIELIRFSFHSRRYFFNCFSLCSASFFSLNASK